MATIWDSADPGARVGLTSVLDRAHAAARHIDDRWPYNPTLLDAWDGLGVALAEHLRGQGGPNPHSPGGDLAAGVIPPGGTAGADQSYLWWEGQCYAVPPTADGQELLAWVHAHTPFFGAYLDEWGQQVAQTVTCDVCGYLADGNATPTLAFRPAVAVHGRDLVGLSLCQGHWAGVTWPLNGTDALRFRQPPKKGKN